MEKLLWKYPGDKKKQTPHIKISLDKKEIFIGGISHASEKDVVVFYEPIIDIIHDQRYLINGQQMFIICHLNGVDHESIPYIQKIIEEVAKYAKKVSIDWQHDEENEEVINAGEYLDEELLRNGINNYSMSIYSVS